MLNLGTWKSVGLDRILRFAWANGIRYIDTAKSYGSEPAIGRWLQAMPEVRKQIFLVTKDHPADTPAARSSNWTNGLRAPADRLRRLDLHPSCGRHNFETEVEWPRSKEFKETADAIRKSGKAKFVGFSTHHPNRDADPPGGRRRRVRRRDHGPEQPLARRRRQDEPGPRRLPQGGHRPDLDEAGRRPHRSREDRQGDPRPARKRALALIRACCTRSGPTSGSPRAASRCGTPTRFARTPRPPGSSSR